MFGGVLGLVPSFSFITDRGRERYRPEKAVEVMKAAYARRNKVLSATEVALAPLASGASAATPPPPQDTSTFCANATTTEEIHAQALANFMLYFGDVMSVAEMHGLFAAAREPA